MWVMILVLLCCYADTFIAKYIEACISHSPDVYLDEIRTRLEEACGVKVHESTVWRALKRRGFTLKKVSIRVFMLVCISNLNRTANPRWQITKAAMERSDSKRFQYMYRIGLNYQPDQLVFVDESSFDRRATYRNNAYALKGQRALRKCFFVRGKRYSFSILHLLNALRYS
jgi:hypothetical protein